MIKKKPKNRPIGRAVTVRFYPETLKKLKAKAKSEDMKVEEYIQYKAVSEPSKSTCLLLRDEDGKIWELGTDIRGVLETRV